MTQTRIAAVFAAFGALVVGALVASAAEAVGAPSVSIATLGQLPEPEMAITPPTTEAPTTTTTVTPVTLPPSERNVLLSETTRLEGEVERLRAELASVPGRVSVTGKQVALTFDDGPTRPWTEHVLDILDEHGVKATFFALGEMIELRPELAKRVVDEGHSLQNHTWSHSSLTRMSDAAAEEQLLRTNDIIEETSGVRPTCYRPPYGATNPDLRTRAQALGLTEIMWNVDTMDWAKRDSEQIVDFISATRERAIDEGLIVLMHDGPSRRAETIDALGPMIEGFIDEGYTFVTLCQSVSQIMPKYILTSN